MEIRGIPVGFGIALLREPDALRNFTILPEEMRATLIERVKASSGKTEVQQVVDALASGKGI